MFERLSKKLIAPKLPELILPSSRVQPFLKKMGPGYLSQEDNQNGISVMANTKLAPLFRQSAVNTVADFWDELQNSPNESLYAITLMITIYYIYHFYTANKMNSNISKPTPDDLGYTPEVIRNLLPLKDYVNLDIKDIKAKQLSKAELAYLKATILRMINLVEV